MPFLSPPCFALSVGERSDDQNRGFDRETTKMRNITEPRLRTKKMTERGHQGGTAVPALGHARAGPSTTLAHLRPWPGLLSELSNFSRFVLCFELN